MNEKKRYKGLAGRCNKIVSTRHAPKVFVLQTAGTKNVNFRFIDDGGAKVGDIEHREGDRPPLENC